MDPNTNLRRQREISQRILALVDGADDNGELSTEAQAEVATLADELATLVQALDGWITNGGFLPAEWSR